MKRIYFLLLIVSFNTFSQQKLNITNEARYELKFKQYRNMKPEYLINTFILLFNNSESHFKNMSVYVKDSLVQSGKIRLTGNIEKDYPIYAKYIPNLPYTVYRNGSQINFANELENGNFRYIEDVKFNWKITNEKKNINGVKCIKATTIKWGRNWIAYYSPNHPTPFGPYKFYGLPGLIFEVGDDKGEYTFSIYRYKKRVQKNFLLFNLPKAKKVTKSEYKKIRHNSALLVRGNATIDGKNVEKDYLKFKENLEKNYNPLELTD